MQEESSASGSPSQSNDGSVEAAPQQRFGRTLVLCFDGTAGQFDSDNSNVVKFFSLLAKDPNDQLCYYQPGIGTWFQPGIVSPLLYWFAAIMDLAIAWYLDEHVLDGYRFLMQNYKAGDRICLFGFSRGAYTARALAGMLHKVGLLPKDNDAQMPFAYKLFQREDDEGLVLSEGFKRTYCKDVNIEFVGVWDTVASVGVIMGRSLPFTNSNSSIKTFRHAVSLDERRARFRPNLYHRPDPANPSVPRAGIVSIKRAVSKLGRSSSSSSDESTPIPGKKLKGKFFSFGKRSKGAKTNEAKGKLKATSQVVEVDILEVWFSGCHSDVGGGAVVNDAPNSLANITLRWMVRQAAASGCGIKFEASALERANIALALTDSDDGGVSEKTEGFDALQPMDDELKRNPLWWILEVVPMLYMWQDAQGVWHKSWSWNLGRGRTVEEQAPNFHETVKTRMQAANLGYAPKAKWVHGTEVYVR